MVVRMLVGALCGLLAVGCADDEPPAATPTVHATVPAPAGRQVTMADYDRIERGMTRSQVETALGPAKTATSDEVLGPLPNGPHIAWFDTRRVLAELQLLKWGSEGSWVYAGLLPGGEVRVRSMRLRSGPKAESVFELFGTYSVGLDGAVTILDDGLKAPPPSRRSTGVRTQPTGPTQKPKSTPTP
jgi:hypothetical protein